MRGRVALDFDSTLAATRETAFELLAGPDHDYVPEEDIKDWTWGFREFGKEAYLSAVWHVWTIRPLEVPPLETGQWRAVNKIRSLFDVDIVTAHPDQKWISKGKKAWLREQGINYDKFVVVDPDKSKAELGYDIYIDDKPALPAEVNQKNPSASTFLVDWPYNEDVDGEYTRVDSVDEARRLLEAEIMYA